MSRTSPRFSRNVRLSVLAASSVVLLAGHPAERLEKMVAKKPEKAVERGEAWLAAHPGEEGTTEVRRAVILAAFTVAENADTVVAWQQLQKHYGPLRWPEAQAALRSAGVREEAAAWRDVNAAGATVATIRRFLSVYTHGSLTETARAKEASLAYASAVSADSAEVYAAWRADYAAWPEAAEWLPEVRKREMQRAFTDAEAVQSSETWSAWLEAYGEWTDAPELVEKAQKAEFGSAEDEARQKGTVGAWKALQERFFQHKGAKVLLQRARVEEALAALSNARAAGTPTAARSWSALYGADALPADLREQAAAALAPLLLSTPFVLQDIRGLWQWAADTTQGPSIDAFYAKGCIDLLSASANHWLDADWGGCGPTMASLPSMPTVATANLSKLQKSQGKSPTLLAQWRLAQLLADDPTAPTSLSYKAGEAWWKAVQQRMVPASLFLQMFPTHPRAEAAEAALHEDLQGALVDLVWPRAEVAYSHPLDKNRTEVVFDVRDCKGDRVGGLPESAFVLWNDGAQAPIRSFSSIEDDRPLSLTVAIDLSGSMQTEQAAVRDAAEQLVRTMEYRGRDLRLGLIGFAETIPVHHKPTRGVESFLKALRSLPSANAGGYGEDTAGALAQAALDVAASPGERAVLVLSDEPLQVHKTGRALLNIKDTDCDRMRALGQCFEACPSTVDCYHGCFSSSGGTLGLAMRDCEAANRHLRNARLACIQEGHQALQSSLQACSDELDHPELPEVLTRYLGQRRVRPLFLVSRDTDKAYAKLASTAQGRSVWVPGDATSVEPYTEAILDIADQLSKQYRVVVDGTLSPSAWVAVGDRVEWVRAADVDAQNVLPITDHAQWSGAPVATYHLTVLDPYSVQLSVQDDGAVLRSVAGAPPRVQLPADHAGRALMVVPGRGGLPRICVASSTGALCSDDLGRTFAAVGQADDATNIDLAVRSDGTLSATIDGVPLELARVVSRDMPSSAVFFDTDSDVPKADEGGFLAAISKQVAGQPGTRLRIEGHTDASGDAAYNLDLSERRAAAVRQSLVTMGIPAERITSQGFGARVPVRAGKSEADYARNRRVELVVLEPTRIRKETTCGQNEAPLAATVVPRAPTVVIEHLAGPFAESQVEAVAQSVAQHWSCAAPPKGMPAWMSAHVEVTAKGQVQSVNTPHTMGLSPEMVACATSAIQAASWPTAERNGRSSVWLRLEW